MTMMMQHIALYPKIGKGIIGMLVNTILEEQI